MFRKSTYCYMRNINEATNILTSVKHHSLTTGCMACAAVCYTGQIELICITEGSKPPECFIMLLVYMFVFGLETIDAGSHMPPERVSKSFDMRNESVTNITCDVSEHCVDCSCRGFQNIPDNLPHNITCLNLRGNDIRSINGTDLRKYKHLAKLSLSNNSIHAIGGDDFTALSSLEMLDLSLNNIPYDTIDQKAFQNLPLIYLDLKQNPGNAANTVYPKSLVNMSIERLMIDGIAEPLPRLPNLTELYLSGQYGNCIIPHLNENIFPNTSIPNVRKLYLSNCSILSVDKGTFQELTHLEQLDLSWNTDLTLEPMFNITSGLHSYNFKRLNLNYVLKYSKYITCAILKVDNLKNLNNTSIEMILLEGNLITGMTVQSVVYVPPSLKYVSLRDNMPMYSKYADILYTDHSFNQIVYFDTSDMFYEHRPTHFLSENDIACSTLFTRDRVQTSFELIDERLEKFNITPLASTQHLGKSHQHTEYIDLSNCIFDSYNILLKVFDYPQTLKYLNLSGTYVGYALVDNGTLFDTFVNLATLDIGKNAIISLHEGIFEKLVRLERLYLGDNKLTQINFNIRSLKKLKYLDLNSNNLELLTECVTTFLDTLHDLTVNLAGNTLKCLCDKQNIQFLQWMKLTRTTFENIRQTQCVFTNGTSIAIADMDFEKFKDECNPPTFYTVTLLTSLCILTFLITTIGGLIYRYRWNLRYLYYMTKFKLAGGYRPLDDADYEKDIFVSYADNDCTFVRGDIIPQLEESGMFSLLVHNRDFQPGEFVADNIIKAVTSTRRTLVILTPSFLKSTWCMYEMNIARLEGIEANRNILCVVMKEQIPVKCLPIEMIDIIRSKTYIEYPENGEDQSAFWERLKATLSQSI